MPRRATASKTAPARARSKAKAKARPPSRSVAEPETEAEAQSDVRGSRRRGAGPRALWSGTITFGLVSIPVELFPAVRSLKTSLRMVDVQGHPLKRRYFCPQHDESGALDKEDFVRGYPLEGDGFAVVTDDELDALAPEKSRRIELTQFVSRGEIDARYVRGSYFLAPAGDVTQPYHLLARTMEETDRVGIASFVMRGHAYIVAIRAESGLLRADTLRYADELRDPEAMGIAVPTEVDEKLAKRMQAAVEELDADELDPEELHDPGAHRLWALVEAKREAQEDLVEPQEEGAEDTRASVVDLMQVLKERLAGSASASP